MNAEEFEKNWREIERKYGRDAADRYRRRGCSGCRHFDRERMICRAGVSQLVTGQLKGSWVLYGSRNCEQYEEARE